MLSRCYPAKIPRCDSGPPRRNRSGRCSPRTQTWHRWRSITFSVTYPADSARDANGSLATRATVIPVDPLRLPAPLPVGRVPEIVVSIQAGTEAGFNLAGGNIRFDVPAPVTFPNLSGAAPGEQVFINSFDHDAGVWLTIGTATINAAGTAAVSDPGVGILAPGWHFIDPLARLVGGGQDRSDDPCQFDLGNIEAAQRDLALSLAPLDGIPAVARDVYGDLNSAYQTVFAIRHTRTSV